MASEANIGNPDPFPRGSGGPAHNILGETMAAWSEVTPSGEINGALLDAMPAEWAAPLRPIPPSNTDITRQAFDSIARVVSPRLSSRAPSVATTEGSDAVPGTPPDSPDPSYSTGSSALSFVTARSAAQRPMAAHSSAAAASSVFKVPPPSPSSSESMEEVTSAQR